LQCSLRIVRVANEHWTQNKGGYSVRPRVLIVDDEPIIGRAIARLLDKAGYECVAVDSFEIARRMLLTAPPDLLITDIRLGDYNGLQLLIDSPVPMPAIVMSGYPDPVLQSDARHFGASYVTKPVPDSLLLELVSEKTAISARESRSVKYESSSA
jgi:two-component system, NtrC family, response regulator AtoC